jgi:hypothetical protein
VLNLLAFYKLSFELCDIRFQFGAFLAKLQGHPLEDFGGDFTL